MQTTEEIFIQRKLEYKHIKYKKGFKYQLSQTCYITIPVFGFDVQHSQFSLSADGLLIINKGYAWDGASGPMIDIKSLMRASLVHDALYQMMRMELLGSYYKGIADLLLYEIAVEDGMWVIAATPIQWAVSKFGYTSVHPDSIKKEYTAP